MTFDEIKAQFRALSLDEQWEALQQLRAEIRRRESIVSTDRRPTPRGCRDRTR